MALTKRGGFWWVDISIPERPRIRETTGIKIDQPNSRKIADEYHDKYKAELYDKIKSGKTLSDAIKLWLRIKERNKRETSAIKTFLKIYPSRPLSEITGTDIYDALLVKSPANANRIANIIRASINLAVERKWCSEIVIPKREESTPSTRFLTKKEWASLKAELKPHMVTMAEFALATGLRLSNVTKLQWVNVNLEAQVAWVEATDAKGKKLIAVPLSKIALDILKSQIGKHGSYVFVYENEPVSSVKTSWKKALVRAGIDVVTRVHKNGVNAGKEYTTSKFRWHDLRHSWASWHVMNGTPVPVLQELGAWADPKMVNRYAHLSPEHIRKYVDNSN
jgi:integrase